MISPLKGTKDIAFKDARKYQYIIDTATEVVKKYGYTYIQTPIIEETKLYRRSVGDSSDIITKEMYDFKDKSGNDICMRPEGTAGVVRSFISNKLDRQPVKQKFYYYGPMFRYERPQKGRQRQFSQFGCESFGESSFYEDLTIITMISQIFDNLNIKYKLKINSLGCKACMPEYKKELVKSLTQLTTQLCVDCNTRLNVNPLRALDCKNDTCQFHFSKVPKLINSLCKECDPEFEELKKSLDSSGIKYEVDTKLVRGLDYYNKTAFEFVSDEIGSQDAIAGGGRYDSLVEYLEGQSTPAIGFALGIERIMDLVDMPEEEKEGYYIGAMTQEAIELVIKLANEKRKEQKVIIEYTSKGFKSQLKAADKSNARYCVLIGDRELQEKTIWIKDLQLKEEKTISVEEFLK